MKIISRLIVFHTPFSIRIVNPMETFSRAIEQNRFSKYIKLISFIFSETGSQTGSGHGGGGGGGGGSGALFSPRQQAKKKRKSRTAFTNHQIFELEKRFLYQKYLSPADRDEVNKDEYSITFGRNFFKSIYLIWCCSV